MMKIQRVVCRSAAVILLAAAAVPALAASFSAEMVDTRPGQTQTHPFYFRDKSYRFEIVEGGDALVVIVDASCGKSRVLRPSEKLYMEKASGDLMIVSYNPFAGHAILAADATFQLRKGGAKQIGGLPCTKEALSMAGEVVETAWVSNEFGLPLRIETPADGRTIELRNIKPGPQADALFGVPDGYERVDSLPEPVPEWARAIPSAPVATPPFEQTLTEGKILRIRPQAGRHISAQITNAGDAACRFTAVGFKGGRPLSDPSFNTVTLNARDSVSMLFQQSQAVADEIVVRVGQGAVTFKAAFVAGQPPALPQGRN